MKNPDAKKTSAKKEPLKNSVKKVPLKNTSKKSRLKIAVVLMMKDANELP